MKKIDIVVTIEEDGGVFVEQPKFFEVDGKSISFSDCFNVIIIDKV